MSTLTSTAGRMAGEEGEQRVGWALGSLLVLTSSATVLVSEIVAVRMIAPYVGVTLETFSAVIGCVLAGISLGAWVGGWLADRLPTRGLIVGSLVLGGGSLIASPHIVQAIGPDLIPSDPWSALLLASGAFLLPSVALTAITPTVLKALGEGSTRLGSIAGALSAIGTAGALLGNFGAGFVLVGTLRSGRILMFSGIVCLLLAAATLFVLGKSSPTRLGGAILILLSGVAGTQLDQQLPCDDETKYVCLNIDQTAPSTYLIRSNIYSSSVTNVANPLDLQFGYAREVAAVVEAVVGENKTRLSFGYVGGGGYTLPLYFEARYPNSSHIVYEIDGELVERVTTALGINNLTTRFPTRIGDARTEVATSDTDSANFIIGDAFSGISVPWHLTTREFLKDIREGLVREGFYIMNLIDYGNYDLARAEAHTFLSVFGEVAVIAPGYVLADSNGAGANIILIGGLRIPDTSTLNDAIYRLGSNSVAISGSDVDAFIGTATILTDDFAPVDQLLGRP